LPARGFALKDDFDPFWFERSFGKMPTRTFPILKEAKAEYAKLQLAFSVPH
jgi:hypothetical protein